MSFCRETKGKEMADVRLSGDKRNPTAASLGSQRVWKVTQTRTLGTESKGGKAKETWGDPERPNQQSKERLDVFARRDGHRVTGGSPGRARRQTWLSGGAAVLERRRKALFNKNKVAQPSDNTPES